MLCSGMKDNEVLILIRGATTTYYVYEMSRGGTPIETESKLVAAYGWGCGRGMGVTLTGIGFLVEVMKKF